MTPTVSGWLLAGGQGRRMGGLDKGLQCWRGQAMAQSIMERLRPQVSWLGVSANRNPDQYAALLGSRDVFPDDADLPPDSGPLAGILTGLRHAPGDWVMVCPCDTPLIPTDLVTRLLTAALAANVDIATPQTQDLDEQGQVVIRPHWACSLIHKRVYPHLSQQFVKNERKVGRFIQSAAWTAVSFDDFSAFVNINTLETLHARI